MGCEERFFSYLFSNEEGCIQAQAENFILRIKLENFRKKLEYFEEKKVGNF